MSIFSRIGEPPRYNTNDTITLTTVTFWILHHGRNWEPHVSVNPEMVHAVQSGSITALRIVATRQLGVLDVSFTDPTLGRREEPLIPTDPVEGIRDGLELETAEDIRFLDETERIIQGVEALNTNPGFDFLVSKDETKNTGYMQTLKITRAGAIIEDARFTIPEQAKTSLDRYANERLKDLKLVTRAFKFTFPFYQQSHQKRSFRKLFDLLSKTIERVIPYTATAKIPYINTGLPSSDSIFIRLGPYDTVQSGASIVRYLRYVGYLVRKHGLPIMLNGTFHPYVKPRDEAARYGSYYANDAERIANTYNVYEIKIRLNNIEGEHGYLLLYYVKNILKVLETLHRKAHYAESTYRGTGTGSVRNR
jgi:hypothetical protein